MANLDLAASIIPNKAKKRGIVLPSQSYAAKGATGSVYLAFDAILSEDPEWAAIPTANVIEDGATITDHIAIQPDRVTIRFIVTDSPVNLWRSVSDTANIFTGSPSPRTEAHEFLVRLRDQRQPFDFVSGLQTYTSMVITSYTPNRSPDNGDALVGTITLQKVRIVQSQVIEVPAYKTEKKGAQTKQDRGKQATVPPKEATRRRASLFLESLRGLGAVDY